MSCRGFPFPGNSLGQPHAGGASRVRARSAGAAGACERQRGRTEALPGPGGHSPCAACRAARCAATAMSSFQTRIDTEDAWQREVGSEHHQKDHAAAASLLSNSV